MDKRVIMEAMGYIDPKLIQDAASPAKAHRNKIAKNLFIAACVALLLFTTVFAASELFGIPDVSIDKNGQLIGIVPILGEQTDSTRVSDDQFGDAFLKDLADYSWDRSFYYYFDSWTELEEYIGINLLDNTIIDQALPDSMYFGADVIESHGALQAMDNDGRLAAIHVTASYKIFPVSDETSQIDSGSYSIYTPSVNVIVSASAYTQHSIVEEGRMFSSYYYTCETDISKEIYTSVNGKSYTIVRVQDPKALSVSYFGFVYIDNVYITVQTSYVNDEIALETLKKILDGFVVH